jgi:hypothetical protein
MGLATISASCRVFSRHGIGYENGDKNRNWET